MALLAIRDQPGHHSIFSAGRVVSGFCMGWFKASKRSACSAEAVTASAAGGTSMAATRIPTSPATSAYHKLNEANMVCVVGMVSDKIPAWMRKLSGVAIMSGAEPDRPVCHTVPTPR